MQVLLSSACQKSLKAEGSWRGAGQRYFRIHTYRPLLYPSAAFSSLFYESNYTVELPWLQDVISRSCNSIHSEVLPDLIDANLGLQ